MGATEVGASIGVGKAHKFVTDRDGSGTDDDNSAGVVAANSGSAADIGKLLTSISGLPDFTFDMRGTVDVRIASDGLFAEPRDDGQFGLKWSKYFGNVGSGLDFSVSYANYHSKVPYIQFSMPGALFASDALGAYLLSAGDFQGTLDTAAGGGIMSAGTDAAGTFQLNGTENVYKLSLIHI